MDCTVKFSFARGDIDTAACSGVKNFILQIRVFDVDLFFCDMHPRGLGVKFRFRDHQIGIF